MTDKEKHKYETRARIIKAMAHPTRLFIVDKLADSECCVRDLTDLIGDDISTVSRHLSVLKDAGIVKDDKRGQQVWYSLKVPCVLNFFGCIESVLESQLQHLKV